MTRKECRDCKYFKGYCKRHAPVYEKREGGLSRAWPEVSYFDDACGDFKPNETT